MVVSPCGGTDEATCEYNTYANPVFLDQAGEAASFPTLDYNVKVDEYKLEATTIDLAVIAQLAVLDPDAEEHAAAYDADTAALEAQQEEEQTQLDTDQATLDEANAEGGGATTIIIVVIALLGAGAAGYFCFCRKKDDGDGDDKKEGGTHESLLH